MPESSARVRSCSTGTVHRGALRAEQTQAADLDEMAMAMASQVIRVDASARVAETGLWGRFPRTRFALARRLVAGAECLQARDLYRNVQLNPRDRRAGDSAQQAFELLLASYRYQIAAAQRLAFDTARKELQLLIDAGRATAFARERLSLTRREVGVDGWSAKLRDHLSRRMRERGLDPARTIVLDMDRITGRPVFVFRSLGDTVHSANIRELSLARRVVDIHARLVQDLGEGILGWAGAVQLLQTDEHELLSTALSNEIAAWLARLEGREGGTPSATVTRR